MVNITACTNPIDYIRRVEIVSDLSDDVLFTVNKSELSAVEARFFLVTEKNIYETSYGDKIWDSVLDGRKFSAYIKEDLKTFLTKYKILELMAKKEGTELSTEDTKTVRTAAEEMYKLLTDDEKKYIGGSSEDILSIFKNFRLIEVYLDNLTEDIAIEISEDEARVITIQDIFIKTAELENNQVVKFDDEKVRECYAKALSIHEQAVNGSDFSTLAQQYSDSEQTEINVERNLRGEAFDKVAFSLEKGQIGDIIETETGYHIIKCLDSYNEALTATHKEKMLYDYKSEYFKESYDEFVSKAKALFNNNLWGRLDLGTKLTINGQDFFTVYYKYFG